MLRPLSLLKKLPVFLFVYVSANMAGAQDYNSSVSVATGGTGRAAVEPGDSGFLNPATLTHLGGRYLFTSFAENNFAASLTDNTKESPMPASFNYVQRTSQRDNLGEVKQHDFGVSLAGFIFDKWSLGLTTHYLEQILAKASYRQVNGDLGVLYTPIQDMGVALVAYNIFGENKDAPEQLRNKTSVGAGFNYVYQSVVRFRADADSESKMGAGVETFVNRFVVTRLGYSDDLDDPRPLVSGGAGFSGPRFRLNYAYFGNTQKSSDYRHSVDLVIPF